MKPGCFFQWIFLNTNAFRIASLECILVLASKDDHSSELDDNLNIMVAETLTIIFPGIIQACIQMINDGEDKQGIKVLKVS